MIGSKYNNGALVVVLLGAFSRLSVVFGQERISIEAFKAGLDNGSYDLVLDVRTDTERASGYIPGTIHVPMANFEENAFWESISSAASSCRKECATIVTSCSVGGRAATAIQLLRNMGFEGTLINGQGTQQWVAAGYDLTTKDDDSLVVEPICASTDICPDSTAATTATEVELDNEEVKVETELGEGPSVISGAAVATNGASTVVTAVAIFVMSSCLALVV